RFVDVVEIRGEPVEVLLRELIELVVVAAAATQGEPEPDGRRRFDAIDDIIDPRLLRDASAFAVDHVIAVEAGGNFLRDGSVREEVAGDLLDGELIEGHVPV